MVVTAAPAIVVLAIAARPALVIGDPVASVTVGQADLETVAPVASAIAVLPALAIAALADSATADSVIEAVTAIVAVQIATAVVPTAVVPIAVVPIAIAVAIEGATAAAAAAAVTRVLPRMAAVPMAAVIRQPPKPAIA